MHDIRDAMRGLDAEQMGELFGPHVRAAYEKCRNGAAPDVHFPKGGVRYMAGLEARAQHWREWRMNRKIELLREES